MHPANGVVCAVLTPHAPVIVPEVGGERCAAATCRAMREVARCVVNHNPDAIVMVSPHAPRRSGVFGIWADDLMAGSFELFGAPQARASFPNDRRLGQSIMAEARARNVQTWLIRHRTLDHGALVPLWFLAEAGWAGPVVLASLNYPEEGGLTSLGEAIAAAAQRLSRRIAMVASGDMSHRLSGEAPSGFHPDAHRFEEEFIKCLQAGELRKLLNLEPALRELAAEDAVDSTVVAAAAAGWKADGHAVLSYEHPFGVGYGVAVLFSAATPSPATANAVTSQAGAILPGIARRSVTAALLASADPVPAAPEKYLNQASGVFVTIRLNHGELRGCIGTLQPVHSTMVEETWCNARTAAFQDARFAPVTAAELADIKFEVSVVHALEDADEAGLNPDRFGVIVSTGDGRRGVLLPGIEEIRTVKQQLQLARRKGGIDADERVNIQRFQVNRFVEGQETST